MKNESCDQKMLLLKNIKYQQETKKSPMWVGIKTHHRFSGNA